MAPGDAVDGEGAEPFRVNGPSGELTQTMLLILSVLVHSLLLKTLDPLPQYKSFSTIFRFMADKAGTYWYHSHLGTQRSMGLAGPLIVLPKSREDEQRRRVRTI